MSKCDVCGRDARVIVCTSTCGAISFAYCEECLMHGIEPYDALLGMGLYYADVSENYRKNILDPSLKFHGKTREQFDDDVLAMDEELSAWLAEREKTTECNEYRADDFEM